MSGLLVKGRKLVIRNRKIVVGACPECCGGACGTLCCGVRPWSVPAVGPPCVGALCPYTDALDYRVTGRVVATVGGVPAIDQLFVFAGTSAAGAAIPVIGFVETQGRCAASNPTSTFFQTTQDSIVLPLNAQITHRQYLVYTHLLTGINSQIMVRRGHAPSPDPNDLPSGMLVRVAFERNLSGGPAFGTTAAWLLVGIDQGGVPAPEWSLIMQGHAPQGQTTSAPVVTEGTVTPGPIVAGFRKAFTAGGWALQHTVTAGTGTVLRLELHSLEIAHGLIPCCGINPDSPGGLGDSIDDMLRRQFGHACQGCGG